MRIDATLDQLAEQLPGAIGDVAGETIGLEIEAFFRPFDHGLGRRDLLGDPCRRRLDIQDDRVSLSIR